MNATPPLAPELLSRLERLAALRHQGSEHLLSEAIRTYLEREEQVQSRPMAKRRIPGGDENSVFVAPDFNTPLPTEIEDTFYS